MLSSRLQIGERDLREQQKHSFLLFSRNTCTGISTQYCRDTGLTRTSTTGFRVLVRSFVVTAVGLSFLSPLDQWSDEAKLRAVLNYHVRRSEEGMRRRHNVFE